MNTSKKGELKYGIIEEEIEKPFQVPQDTGY